MYKKVGFFLLFFVALWLSSAQSFGQNTTVFSENFNSTSNWVFDPRSIASWSHHDDASLNSPYIKSSKVAGTISDTNLYGYRNVPIPILANKTYKISFACSLSGIAGSREVVIGFDRQMATRKNATIVYSRGVLAANGWQTFSGYFDGKPFVSSKAGMAIWVNALDSTNVNSDTTTVVIGEQIAPLQNPKNAIVYVDNISLVQFNNTAPNAVSIISPVANSIGNYPFTITATASDPDNNLEKVQFYTGNTLLGEDFTAPYSYQGTLPPGTQKVKAVAIDAFGLQLTSANRTIRVNTAPVADVISPGNNTLFMTSPVQLSAMAEDFDGNLENYPILL